MKHFVIMRWSLAAFCTMLLFVSPASAQLSVDELNEKITNREQLTDVPTIYITIPDVSDLDRDLYKDRANNIALYHDAIIQVVDNSEEGTEQHLESFTDYVTIKVRGNSTADPSKRAYRLKFAKKMHDPNSENITDSVTSKKHDLLGLGYSERSWALLANTFDHSHMRNALTYHLGQYIGMPFCPGYKFIDLVINEDYRGSYQVSDHINAGKSRVNIDEDNDWMMEFVSWTNMLDDFYVDDNIPLLTNIKNPDGEDLTAEEQTTLKNQVREFVNKWYNSFGSNDSKNGWPAYNDVESFVKFYLAINITADWDGFFVMKTYRTTDGPLFWGPLWDKDLAFGNYSRANADLMVETYENGNFRYRITEMLYNDPVFVAKAKEIMDGLVENGLYENLCNDIDHIAQTTSANWLQDLQKWTDGSTGIESLYNLGSQAAYAQQLKDFLRGRITMVKDKVDELYENIYGNVQDYIYNPQSEAGDGYLSMWSINGKVGNLTISPAEPITGQAWMPLFLFFNLTEAQLSEVIGQYDLREYTGVKDGEFQFNIPASKDIFANVPYLIRLKDESATAPSTWTFSNVIFTPNPDNPYGRDNPLAFTDGDYKLYGLYHPKKLATDGTNWKTDGNGSLIIPESSYWDQTTGQTVYPNEIHGTTIYFEVPSGITPSLYIEEEQLDGILGDVNDDGEVDIIDITLTANYLLGRTITVTFIEELADVNKDGDITVSDITAIANIILGRNWDGTPKVVEP